MRHIKSFLFLVAALLVVILLGIRIYMAQVERLNQAELDYNEGRAVLLDGETTPEVLSSLLISRGYVQSEEEATFIGNRLIGQIKKKEIGRPKGIRSLSNGKRYGIELDSTGFASIANYPYLRTRAELLAGGAEIDINKKLSLKTEGAKKYAVKIRNENGRPLNDTVYLRIREHYYVIEKPDGKVRDCCAKDSIFAWVPICGKTEIWLPENNSNGIARHYSILPIERGYVFGREQGTYRRASRSFEFERKRAMLPLLGNVQLKQIREDNSILVRSPKEYKGKFITAISLFVALWLFAFLILSVVDIKRGGKSNLEILAVIALLCGFGIFNLFALADPLWGDLLAWAQLSRGVLLGLVVLLLCSLIDWTAIFKYSSRNHLASGHPERQGLWMAAGALLIAMILLLFGNGPSGVHTNLPLPGLEVQGSPFIKLLCIGYLSVFFSSRDELLEAYAKPGKMRKQLIILLAAIIVCVILGTIQLAISDLGPFLVIILTAIFIFSLYSNETIPMLIVSGIFGLGLWLCNHSCNHPVIPYAMLILYSSIWIVFSRVKYERIIMSPIILCLVLLLAFNGGGLFKILGMENIPVAERLLGRSEISANIFDNEVRGGSQCAHGIWAVSRGGLFGAPQFGLSAGIPAGHTDLIFESLIENFGIFGGLVVLICIGMLIFISLKIGIQNGHPFSFSIASLISLSFGIQALLIILGSLGTIPLTGISLPMLSYGSTELIVDMACMGILISLSRNKDIDLERLNTRKFERVAQGVFGAYVGLACVVLAFVLNYGMIFREHYLVKPGQFINKYGERIVVTNPLIKKTIKKLIPGDVFDRNGEILATTNPDGTRKYPYGDYTFFMLGDCNTKVQWGTTGKRPSGLRAEERYELYIKGFDTKPVKVPLSSRTYYSPFLPNVPMEKNDTIKVENFMPLIPFMKSNKKLNEWNEGKAERNITLTIDAELQKDLSNKFEEFFWEQKQQGRLTDKTRITTVIMDASDCSLLTSAIFPLPNQDTLRKLALTGTNIYRDGAPGFKAYADMDLGLVVPSAPGSAVKTLSSGAGLRRFGPELASERYNQMVYSDEIIDVELGEPVGSVDLNTSIGGSSNVYFIKLLNQYGEAGLYPELATLYYAVGAGFGKDVPYTLYPDDVITREEIYRDKMINFGKKAAKKYSDYVSSGERHKLNDAEYQPAWGQGEVVMTPLAICRYISAVVNGGVLMTPRYVTKDSVKVFKQLLTTEEACVLQDCMRFQAAGRFGDFSEHIGGKTGTPSRSNGHGGVTNDAIYTFFIDADGTTSGTPLVVTIRLERVMTYSKIAIQLANEVVLPTLKEKGYIK